MILQWVLLVLTVGTLGAYSGLLFVMLAVMMLVVVMLLLSLVVVVCVCVCACFYACICRFVSKRCIPVVMNFRRK